MNSKKKKACDLNEEFFIKNGFKKDSSGRLTKGSTHEVELLNYDPEIGQGIDYLVNGKHVLTAYYQDVKDFLTEFKLDKWS